MRLNDLENYLYQTILDNWGDIDKVEIFIDDLKIDVSDCEGDFLCERKEIQECIYLRMPKNFCLSLKDFFSDKWGIRLTKNPKVEVYK